MKKILLLFLSLAALALVLPGCTQENEPSGYDAKPVIYLYPEEEMEVTVRLRYDGELTCTYPAISEEGTWTVTAAPDSTLTDETGRSYYCLFWEGISHWNYDFSEGFCVSGQDTAAFLEGALADLGLTDREANEFLIYWLPQMEHNAYNLISFQAAAYTDHAGLTVSPQPDTVLRVFMAFQPLTEPVDIDPQALTVPIREGFTLVEWGGCQVSPN